MLGYVGGLANACHPNFAQFGNLYSICSNGGNLKLDRRDCPNGWIISATSFTGVFDNKYFGLFEHKFPQLAIEPTAQSTIQSQMHQSQQQKQFRAELTSSVLVMSRMFRVQSFATIKGAVQLIEAFAKWLVEILHKTPVDLWDL